MELALSSCSTRIRFPNSGVVECGNVSCRMDIGMAGAQELVHDDSVFHLEPDGLGKFHVWLDADSRHHAVHPDFPVGARFQDTLVAACFQTDNLFACQHLDTLLPVEVGHKPGEKDREEAISNIFAGEDHRHFFPVQGQRRGDLRTDKPATDHGEPPTRFGERAKTSVIRQGAEVNDPVVSERKATWPAARGQQEFLVGENVSLVVHDTFLLGNDLFDDAAKVNLDPFVPGLAPEDVQGLSLPKRLRERRTIIRGIRLRADQPDPAG